MSRTLTLGGLVLGAFLMLIPFLWMLSLSLKAPDEIFTPDLDLLPDSLHWANYVAAFGRDNLLRSLWNGAVVCASILVLQMLFAVPCAFALAQRHFVGKHLVFGLVLAGLLVPFHVTAIPIFLGLA